MISVKNVCLKFTKEFYALFDVSFEIKRERVSPFLVEKIVAKQACFVFFVSLKTSIVGKSI